MTTEMKVHVVTLQVCFKVCFQVCFQVCLLARVLPLSCEAMATAGVAHQRRGPGPLRIFGNGQHVIHAGDAHTEYQSALVAEGLFRGLTPLQIADVREVSLNLMQVESMIIRIYKNNGSHIPGTLGTHGNHARKVFRWHTTWLQIRLFTLGARQSADKMARDLYLYFGLEITGRGLRYNLDNIGLTWKRLTYMCKHAFTAANVEITRRVRRLLLFSFLYCTLNSTLRIVQFLIRRLGLLADEGVFVDECLFKKHQVGHGSGWARVDMRAEQKDITQAGQEAKDSVMMMVAVTTDEVLPITLPVPQPNTVTGFLTEWWCQYFLIPTMLQRGKTNVVMDNARVHRRNVLRALFHAHGLQVHFLPPYSPWYAPPEKIFLSTHMRCAKDVEWTRGAFIRHVCDILHHHSPHECRRVCEICGWY